MRSFFSRLGVALLSLFFLGCLVVALLPTIASTDWGRNQIVHWINRSIPGQLEIRSMALHWGTGQMIDGVLLKDPEGHPVIGVEKMATEGSLWQLLMQSTHLGLTQVQELNASIAADDEGWTNLQRALGLAPHSEHPAYSSSSTILLSDVNADLHLFSENKPLSLHITGETKQGALSGTFTLNTAFKRLKASNWEDFQKEAQDYLSMEHNEDGWIHAKIVNFPVDLIDRLATLKHPEFKGVFRSFLGDRLNVMIEKEAANTEEMFTLIASAPLMKGAVKGGVQKGLLTLVEPAAFEFTLTPEFINLSSADRLNLLQPSVLKVVLHNLSLPFVLLNDTLPINLCQLGFKANTTLDSAEVVIPEIGRLRFDSLTTEWDAPMCSPSIQIATKGEARYDRAPFTFELQSTLVKALNFSNLQHDLLQNMQLSLDMHSFPLQLIPAFKEHAELADFVGKTADLQAMLKHEKDQEWLATLSLETPLIKLHGAQFQVDHELSLISPAQFKWELPMNCLEKALGESELALDQSCKLDVAIQHLRLPLTHHETAQFDIESTIPLLRWNHISSFTSLQVKNLRLQLNGNGVNDISSKVTGQIALLNRDGAPSQLLDTPLQVTHTASWAIDREGIITIPKGKLEANNRACQVFIEGSFSSDKGFKLSQPAHLHYILTPEGLQSVSQALHQDWPLLKKAAVIDFLVEPSSFNSSSPPFSLSRIHAKGMLTIDELNLKSSLEDLPVIEEVEIPWSVDGAMNTLSIYLSGLAYTKNSQKPSQFSTHIEVERWLDEEKFNPTHAKIELQMELINLLTSDISLLLNQQDLNPLFGAVMDIELKTLFDLNQQTPGFCDFNIDSSAFHSRARLKFDQAITILDPIHPVEFRWTVSPEGYDYLKTLIGWEGSQALQKAVTFTGTIPDMQIPLEGTTVKLNQGQFNFNFKSSAIEWQGLSQSPYIISGSASSANIGSRIEFSTNVQSHGSSILTAAGTIGDLDMGSHFLQHTKMDFTIKAPKIPLGNLRSLLLLDDKAAQKIKAIFGSTLEIAANVHLDSLSGPVTALIKGEEGSATLDGKLTQGILTLASPLQVSTQMTPQLSQAFFAENIPLLSSTISGEHPLKLMIDPAQFSCPLVPFTIDQLKIGKGSIDLGKVRVHNEGELEELLNLISPLKAQQMILWFTPVFFHLENGRLTIKRVDVLVDHAYALASWGTIDLKTHEMNLILGLTGQTLQYAFGLQGIDEHYLLQIPLHSRKGKIEIDKKKLTGRITALLARTQGGSKGKLLGDLLNIAISEPGEATPPAPTTQPLPWASEMKSESTKNKPERDPAAVEQKQIQSDNEKELKKSNKKKKQPTEFNEDSLKQELQQGASKLLEHLFSQ